MLTDFQTFSSTHLAVDFWKRDN